MFRITFTIRHKLFILSLLEIAELFRFCRLFVVVMVVSVFGYFRLTHLSPTVELSTLEWKNGLGKVRATQACFPALTLRRDF